MSKKKKLKCEECDNTVEVDTDQKTVHECCGQPMKEELPVCTTTETAEHARFNEGGEPCDDGRAG